MSLAYSKYQEMIFKKFEETNENLFISALAGTGKTFTLVELSKRIKDPKKKAVFIAFNKSIQLELAEKIKNPAFKTSTFNSLGYSVLLFNSKKENRSVTLDINKTYSLVYEVVPKIFKQYSKEELSTISDDFVELWELCKAKNLDLSKENNIKNIIATNHLFVDFLKDNYWGESFLDLTFVALRELQALNLEKFEKEGIINFSDQLYLTLYYLQTGKWFVPPYLKFDYIFGDETQDWNRVQQTFSLYLRKANCRIILVGDQYQAIYAFNGADGHSFENLKKLYNMTELSLPINYRCPRKHLAYVRKRYPYIKIQPCDTATEGMLCYCNKAEMYEIANPGDFILSRINSQLCEVAIELLKRNKPIYIKDATLVNKLIGVVKKVKKSAKNLNELETNLKEVRREYRRKLNDEMKRLNVENLNQQEDYNFSDGKVDLFDCVFILLTDFKKKQNGTIEGFIEHMKKMLNTTDSKNCIVCTSIHQAKGLETETVFVLNKGRDFEDMGVNAVQRQQEKNLAYVALTRAKKMLFLVEGDEIDNTEGDDV